MNTDKVINVTILKDDMCFTDKPTGKEVAAIRKRLENKLPEKLTIDELFEVIKRGNTVVPGVSKDGTKKENFVLQDIIMIDIDNKDGTSILTQEDALKICEDNGLSPLGLYHTFSSTKDCPRFRLIFRLDKTVYDRAEVEFILKVLISLFPNADKQCKDTSRLYYGTNGNMQDVVIFNEFATISLEIIDKIYQSMELKNTPYLQEDYKYNNYIEKLKKEFPLLEYMKEDHKVKYISGNTVYFEDCHLNGNHEGCLRYYTNTNTFNCFGDHYGKGGTIIEYVRGIKKLSYNGALKYIRNELAPKYNIIIDVNESALLAEKASYLDMVVKQLEDYDLGYLIPDEFDWLTFSINEKTGLLKCKVDTAKLAMYLKNNLHYLLVKSVGQNSILPYLYRKGKYVQLLSDEFKSVIKAFIPEVFHSSKVYNEVFNLLMTNDKYITVDDLDNNEDIINYKNGIYNVITDEFTPHSPEIYSTIQIPYNYKKVVPCPPTRYFDNFIEDFSSNSVLKEKSIIQVMGVSHSNIKGQRAKTAVMMVGPGNTGKTIIKSLTTCLVGKENCTGIDLSNLEDKYDRSELLNKRIAGSNDMSFVKLQGLEVFKQVTGGDYIHGSIKYGPSVSFVFNGIIWLCGNSLPKFAGDRGEWVYNRMLIIRCDNVIPKEKQDKKLLEHLLSEAEYILYRLRQGVREFIANGYEYDIPEDSLELKEEYKKENNSVLLFREECMKPRETEQIKDKFYTVYKVYQIYENWYKFNYHNNHYENSREFKKFMGGQDAIKKTHGGLEYYRHWMLTEDAIRRYNNLDVDLDEEIPKNDILESEKEQQTLQLEETITDTSKVIEDFADDLPF